jgi:hypothetical protein
VAEEKLTQILHDDPATTETNCSLTRKSVENIYQSSSNDSSSDGSNNDVTSIKKRKVITGPIRGLHRILMKVI